MRIKLLNTIICISLILFVNFSGTFLDLLHKNTLTTTLSVHKDYDPVEILVYLNDPDNTGTNIRLIPGGEVVMQLIEDDYNDAYVLTLTEVKGNWFKIKNPIERMESDVEIPGGIGWIHNSVISVDTRNYAGQHIKLLDTPETGETVGVIENEVYVKVKNMCGKWVKVEHQGSVGWIENEWLCANPRTTCS